MVVSRNAYQSSSQYQRVAYTNNFSAKIVMGLRRGYTDEFIDEDGVILCLQNFQRYLIQVRHVHLGANCYKSKFVMGGLIEEHMNFEFINYPRFPLDRDQTKAEALFKEIVELFAANLLESFDQNRIVIQFHDSNVMIQKTLDTDSRITSI